MVQALTVIVNIGHLTHELTEKRGARTRAGKYEQLGRRRAIRQTASGQGKGFLHVSFRT